MASGEPWHARIGAQPGIRSASFPGHLVQHPSPPSSDGGRCTDRTGRDETHQPSSSGFASWSNRYCSRFRRPCSRVFSPSSPGYGRASHGDRGSRHVSPSSHSRPRPNGREGLAGAKLGSVAWMSEKTPVHGSFPSKVLCAGLRFSITGGRLGGQFQRELPLIRVTISTHAGARLRG
jgi:hypothetical protein